MQTHPTRRLPLLALLAFAPCCFGDEALQQYHRQAREHDERQVEERLRQLERETPRPDPGRDTPAPSDAACWPVSGLSLSGNQRIGNARIAAATAELLRPCMSAAQINRVLKAITHLYLQAGYLASRPYLARTPISGQPLEIFIVEGFVEAIEVSEPDLPLSLSSAFPGMLGEPLQLRQLEQGMDQLNRLRSFDLTADIEPGEFDGGSRLLLRPRSRPSRWELRASLDNRDGAGQGSHFAQLGAGLDSPAQLNDYLYVAHLRTLANARGNTQLSSLDYRVPYGSWSVAVNFNQMDSQSHLQLAGLSRDTRVAAQSLRAERTLWRDGQRMLNGYSQWTHRTLDSQIAGLQIGVQQSDTQVTEIGLNGLWVDAGLWSADLAHARGRQRIGATPQFEKYRASLGHSRLGSAFGQAWQVSGQLSLQYSPDALPPLEQKNLAVPGFRLAPANSASGVAFDAQLNLPQPLGMGLVLTPTWGIGAGWARHHPRDVLPTRSREQKVLGLSAGASLQWRQTRLSLAYQHPLHDSYAERLPPGFWHSELSLAL